MAGFMALINMEETQHLYSVITNSVHEFQHYFPLVAYACSTKHVQ